MPVPPSPGRSSERADNTAIATSPAPATSPRRPTTIRIPPAIATKARRPRLIRGLRSQPRRPSSAGPSPSASRYVVRTRLGSPASTASRKASAWTSYGSRTLATLVTPAGSRKTASQLSVSSSVARRIVVLRSAEVTSSSMTGGATSRVLTNEPTAPEREPQDGRGRADDFDDTVRRRRRDPGRGRTDDRRVADEEPSQVVEVGRLFDDLAAALVEPAPPVRGRGVVQPASDHELGRPVVEPAADLGQEVETPPVVADGDHKPGPLDRARDPGGAASSSAASGFSTRNGMPRAISSSQAAGVRYGGVQTNTMSGCCSSSRRVVSV